ncbi:hypothetical protein COU60_05605 [Candidatus Pacearchaeota archaeon CG10_big_fil_rev_8_21_14_0_10_34_76]|nr:MAG: hypothetical protein COU60_05605 [Candidatus Pacearchaeota archaeon CG10_big_fil_rev_8_21_14_0_10_34_76]
MINPKDFSVTLEDGNTGFKLRYDPAIRGNASVKGSYSHTRDQLELAESKGILSLDGKETLIGRMNEARGIYAIKIRERNHQGNPEELGPESFSTNEVLR